jgi:hypothetical protein
MRPAIELGRTRGDRTRVVCERKGRIAIFVFLFANRGRVETRRHDYFLITPNLYLLNNC